MSANRFIAANHGGLTQKSNGLFAFLIARLGTGMGVDHRETRGQVTLLVPALSRFNSSSLPQNAMARIPRLSLPNIAQHIVQSGNNRQAIFFHEDDYNIYLGYLREALAKHGGRLFAFVLMTNHVHLWVLCKTRGGISGLMAHRLAAVMSTISRQGTGARAPRSKVASNPAWCIARVIC